MVRIDEFKTRDDALAFARSSPPSSPASHGRNANEAPVSRGPRVERVVPILNVSDIHASFEWFEKLGWDKGFEWKADPSDDAPGFGAVETGSCEIFLCRDGQRQPRQRRQPLDLRPRRRRDLRQRRVDVDLGRRRRHHPSTLRQRSPRYHPPPDRRAMGRPRIPRPPPRRPRVPHQHQPLTPTFA